MSNQSDLAKSAAGFNGDPLSIDTANNRVGVGTVSPLGKVTIANAAGTNAPTSVTAANTYLQLGSDDFGPSNNGKFMIGFGYTDGTNTNSPAYIGYEEVSTSGDTYGDLTFYTRNVTTDTAPSERMRIDSAGRVTMPYQPAFDVGLTSGAVNPTNVVLFNNVRLNRGSHYSSATGRFTAPIAGLYQFYWGGIKNATTSVTRVVLRKNGTSVRENRLAEGISYTNACWTMLIDLSASDYVDIQITEGSFYGQTDFYGNVFGGYLIG